MLNKNTLRGLLLAASILTGISPTVQNVSAAPTVYIAGDSTVSFYRASSAPQQGWGARIPEYFTSGVTFSNRAIGGRSSKSFVVDGRLDTILSLIQPGDYLFVQFAHNDASSLPERHTDPQTTYKEYLRMYIDGARAKGATPVLITPVPRRSFDSAGKFKSDYPAYCTAMKELSVEKSCKLIDLNVAGMAYLNSIGAEASKGIFMWLPAGVYPAFPNGAQDSTHFQEHGANQMARLVSEGVRAVDLPLKTLLKGFVAGTVYPAENATLGGTTPPTVDTTNTGFNGSGYVNLLANTSTLTFNNVAGNGGGTKAITIRYALGGSASRTGTLTVNGSTTNITFAATGSWTEWQFLTVNVTLANTSTNSIRFTTTGGDLGNIDELTVAPGSGGGSTIYQAESAALAGGTVSEATNTGFNGSGYANASLTGGTITFNNVVGNGGGSKTLAIRYANGAATARTGNLVVNGATTSVTFAPTGAWTTWQTLNVTITLNNNSTNTIQFASTGTDLGNVDQITVP